MKEDDEREEAAEEEEWGKTWRYPHAGCVEDGSVYSPSIMGGIQATHTNTNVTTHQLALL